MHLRLLAEHLTYLFSTRALPLNNSLLDIPSALERQRPNFCHPFSYTSPQFCEATFYLVISPLSLHIIAPHTSQLTQTVQNHVPTHNTSVFLFLVQLNQKKKTLLGVLPI